jgi:hypothetical protein
MPADNFVYWKKKNGRKPTCEEVEQVVADFFGEVLKESHWSEDKSRLFVTLVGQWSHPIMRVVDQEIRAKLEAQRPEDPGWQGRFLEVYTDDEHLDVMTRMQDEFTGVCARGLAAIFARTWDGRLDVG